MNKKPGVLIGHKGVQYGLQKAGPKPGAPPAASGRKPAPTNVFGDDDSEEEGVEAQIERQAEKKRAAAKVQQMYEDALAQDPSVFDYDGVYDGMQQARTVPKQQDKVQRQSKYIASLLDQAQQRKREADVLYERRMVRERQQEDHLFEDKEKFVTGAYRRKLEEDKKWQEEERKKELEEQKHDVRSVGHMGNFYANLLTKNVAFGTAKQDEKAKQEQRQEPPEAADADAEQGEAAGRERGASPSAPGEGAGPGPGSKPGGGSPAPGEAAAAINT
ncbi:Nuclear speckle splicing regulatory protein 1 [Tetrabaena socialis]|uniref:Nuclear speckle splicing regulatory protein 1 n=1 Tax=Tetrabaena socialis TaxID=47790 RepID=A0A2J8A7L9_9CHLO|nr:Nuclear speckle splicing regulatory protein 1 [Tetrabaena socialis]|eukprot:PNH08508.1 Nuclear speckle splicing regulatory protein 1 [Tetrabaena socialis]